LIHLEKITRENLDAVLEMKIKEEQRTFVSTAAVSLAKAYVYRDTAFPFAVYDDETPVGFIMLGYYEARNQYTLWAFFIDEKYQGRGYGRRALELGIAYLKEKHGAREVFTGVIPENAAALSLYRSVGFAETGFAENGMLEMKFSLDENGDDKNNR